MHLIHSPLPYVDLLESRAAGQIDLVVIHCTELPDLSAARDAGELVRYPSGTGNSGHFYIERDGSVHQYVEVLRVAHHVRGYNARSVGIELVNRGRYPNWLDSRTQSMDEAYPPAQIRALLQLLQHLTRQLPALAYVQGHEQLDDEEVAAEDDPTLLVRRKLDPGPLFPWPQVMAATALVRLPPTS